MEALIKAGLFLKTLSNTDKSIQAKSGHVKCGEQKFSVDIYYPEQSSKGVILYVHGMTPYGYRDPRMIDLGRATAQSRYTAVIPSYPVITQGLIEASSIGNVIDTVKALVSDKTLCPDGKLAIFTASFSCSICIRAVAQESIRDFVTSLLIIGGCYHPINSFEEIMQSTSADKYAKLLLLKNLAKKQLENDVILSRALSCAVEDEFLDNGQSNAYKSYLEFMTVEDRKRIIDFIEPVLQGKHNPLIEYEKEVMAIHNAFMRYSDIKNIRCSVILLHSDVDDVVSPTESETLYKELQANSIESYLLITPLLEHAGMKFKISYAIDVVRLLRIFSRFFSAMEDKD